MASKCASCNRPGGSQVSSRNRAVFMVPMVQLPPRRDCRPAAVLGQHELLRQLLRLQLQREGVLLQLCSSNRVVEPGRGGEGQQNRGPRSGRGCDGCCSVPGSSKHPRKVRVFNRGERRAWRRGAHSVQYAWAEGMRQVGHTTVFRPPSPQQPHPCPPAFTLRTSSSCSRAAATVRSSCCARLSPTCRRSSAFSSCRGAEQMRRGVGPKHGGC